MAATSGKVGGQGTPVAEQGEEEDESELESGKAAIEHVCVYGLGGSIRRKIAAGVHRAKPRTVTGLLSWEVVGKL